jgi:hypothetical protein
LTGVAVYVTEVPSQTKFAEAEIETPTNKLLSITINIVLLVAGLFVMQAVSDEVKSQVTWSPVPGMYVKMGLFTPALTPFTFHWYDGDVPPLMGVAVYVTDVPSQTGFADAEIETLTNKLLSITINILLDIAGLFVAHK